MKFLSQQNSEMFYDKRVLVRVDFNIPIVGNTVSDSESFRIHETIPTIQWLLDAGAKVILIAHIGRDGDTLLPVAEYIQHQFPAWNLTFIQGIVGDSVDQALEQMQPRSCVMLENVRQNPGEETNDPIFAGQLAGYADYFVNDAFAVTHRPHASVVGIPDHIPGFAGLLLEKEITELDKVAEPAHPAVLIMAGVKFETKLVLIEKLLPAYEYVVLGGGLLNTYMSQLGCGIGLSVFDQQANLKSLLGNQKILLPEMVIVERNGVAQQILLGEVIDGDIIVDIVISDDMKQKLSSAQTIVWNGPLGWYEKGYTQSSQDILETFHDAQTTIVGGGDTVTVIQQLRASEKISFISTGGGAMLEYLEKGTLPGLEALK